MVEPSAPVKVTQELPDYHHGLDNANQQNDFYHKEPPQLGNLTNLILQLDNISIPDDLNDFIIRYVSLQSFIQAANESFIA